MNENLYAEYPEVYDAIYSQRNYDAEVAFVRDRLDEHVGEDDDSANRRALVVGCGPGEHSKRLHEAGLDVIGVDKYEAMVELARTKSDAEFRVGELPGMPVEGAFDLVWLPFTIVNHFHADEVDEALDAAAQWLTDDGVLVFDRTAPVAHGDGPQLGTHETESGTFAMLTQLNQIGREEYRYDGLMFTPDGEFFVDTHLLVDHEPDALASICADLGLSVERYGWYDENADPEDGTRTVFVASPS